MEDRYVVPFRMIVAFLIGMLVGAAALSTSVLASEKLVNIFARAENSVGALYKLTDNGSMQFLCSVTAIDEDAGETVLLTAFHCVTRGVSYRVTLDGETYHSARVWKIPGYEVDPEEYQRGYNDPLTDMALFKSDTLEAPIVEVADYAGQRPGSDVVMMGFPLGVAKVSYQGIVSGYFDRPGHDQDGYQLLQIFGAPGSSGSAVIDVESGKIISVLVSAKQARAGLPVIFATPIEYRRYLQEVPTGKAKQVGSDE